MIPTRTNAVIVRHTPPDDTVDQLVKILPAIQRLEDVRARLLPVLVDGVGELKKMVDDVSDELDRCDALRKAAVGQREAARQEIAKVVRAELPKLVEGVADLKRTCGKAIAEGAFRKIASASADFRKTV